MIREPTLTHNSIAPPCIISNSNKQEAILFLTLTVLGTIASYISINIPHTDVFIEARWLFGYMGFVLLRRWWSAFLLAVLLSITTCFKTPILVCLLGNMLYALPSLITIRYVHNRYLNYTKSLITYGAGWFCLVLFCYQAYNTPAVWAVLALLDNEPIVPAVISSWVTQPFLLESIFIAIVSALALSLLKNYKALQKSQEDLNFALKAADMGTWDRDLETDKINWSEEQAELFGISLHEFGGTRDDFIKRVHPNDIEHVKKTTQNSLLSGEDIHCNYRAIWPDGSIHWMQSYGKVIYNEQGKPIRIAGTTQDITKRKFAEESYSRFCQMATEMICVADYKSAKFLQINPSFEKILGYSEEELLHHSFLDFVHPDDIEKTRNIIQEKLDQGHSIISFQNRHRCKNGEYVNLLWNSYPLPEEGLTYAIAYNITEKILIEQHLQLQANVLEQIHDQVTVTDLQGNITYVNKAVCRKLNRTEQELIGQNVAIYGEDPDIGATQNEIIQNTLEHGSWRGEVVNYNNDGKPVILDCRTYIMYDEEGKPKFLCGISTDISERKKAEEELKKNEHLFRSFVENANDIVYALTPEGIFTYISPNWLELIGEPAETVIGKSFRDYVHPEDVHLCQEFLEKVLQTESKESSVEYRVLRTDGTIRWHMSNGSPLRDEDGKVISYIGIARDITEQKIYHEELERSNERFRNLLEHLDIIPVQGYNANREVIYWNTASEYVYGYSSEEAMGKKLEDLIIPEEMTQIVIDLIHQWLTTGATIPSEEIVLRDKNNNPVPVYSTHIVHSSSTGEKELFCVDVDLRTLRKAEEELRRLAAAIEQTDEIVVITDSAGSIQYVNPSFEKVTGYYRDEVIGKNPRILKSGQHDHEHYKQLWETITSGKTWEGRFINKRKDGEIYTEDVSISPIWDATGNIINFVAVKRDITEHLRIHEEKANLEQQIQRTQKLESIGRLAGGVAHDLNNLLTPILGYSMMLRDTLKEDMSSFDSLDEIVQASTRARDLIGQLLAFSSKQMLEFKPLDLNAIIDKFMKLLRRTIREDITIDVFAKPNLPCIDGDPGQIEQVIMNLAVNAQDAMPNGGTLTIKTELCENLDESDHVSISKLSDRCVTLSIQDTGFGIDEETQQHLFEPFFTTKSKDKGTGLGLSTVYGIIKQHGGEILVDSTVNVGSTFTVFLPTSKQNKALDTPEEREGTDLYGSETILLVEDNDQVRKLANNILVHYGYRVITAIDGNHALELIDQVPHPIHLLLTDIIMPTMNGVDLYRKITNHIPNIKALYMSGYTDHEINYHGDIDKKTNFIQKPFTMQALASKIRDILDKHNM